MISALNRLTFSASILLGFSLLIANDHGHWIIPGYPNEAQCKYAGEVARKQWVGKDGSRVSNWVVTTCIPEPGHTDPDYMEEAK